MKFLLLIVILVISISQTAGEFTKEDLQKIIDHSHEVDISILQLTDDQLDTIALDIFTVYDFNGSGFIETDELIPALQAVQDQAQTGYVVDRAFAQLVLNQMDTNMDNKLTFLEFKKIIYAFMVEDSPV